MSPAVNARETGSVMLGREDFDVNGAPPAGRIEDVLGDRVDLTAIDTSERRPFIPGAKRFLRAGVPVIMFGPRGSGKSLIALLSGEQIIDAGGSVAYIDFENGSRRMAERVSAILDERDEDAWRAVRERLAYFPRVRLTKADPDSWAQALEGYTVVIIDSLARALSQLGLDENSTPDFGKFVVRFIDPLTSRGAAVLILDNTGWSETERTRGASGKWDLVELVYKVASDDIAPGRHGHIRLERKRSRDGDEALRLECGVGGGTYTRLEVSDRDQHGDVLSMAIAVLKEGGHTDRESSLGYTRLASAIRSRGIKVDDKTLRSQLTGAASDPETALHRPSEGGQNARGFYVVDLHHVDDVVKAPPHGTTYDAGEPENAAAEPDSYVVQTPPRSTTRLRGDVVPL